MRSGMRACSSSARSLCLPRPIAALDRAARALVRRAMLALRHFVPRIKAAGTQAAEFALDADRPLRRQLHQHPDGEAVRPRRSRGCITSATRIRLSTSQQIRASSRAYHASMELTIFSDQRRADRSRRSASRCGCGRAARDLGSIARGDRADHRIVNDVAAGSSGSLPASSRTSARCTRAWRRSREPQAVARRARRATSSRHRAAKSASSTSTSTTGASEARPARDPTRVIDDLS